MSEWIDLPPSLRRQAAAREDGLLRRWGHFSNEEMQKFYNAAQYGLDGLENEIEDELKRRGML